MDLLQHWNAINLLTASILFVMYIVIDGMYAYYTLAVAEKRPYRAATSGALMHFMLAVGVLSYVENYLYVIPLALGSWVGTYIVVKKSTSLQNEG